MHKLTLSTLFLGLTVAASCVYAEAYAHLYITVVNNTNQPEYSYFKPLNQAHNPAQIITPAHSSNESGKILAWGFNQSGSGSGWHHATGCFINAIGNGTGHRQYSINYEGQWNAAGTAGSGSKGEIMDPTAITPNTSNSAPGAACWSSYSAITNDPILQQIIKTVHGTAAPAASYQTPTGAIAPMNFGPHMHPVIGGTPAFSYGPDFVTILSFASWPVGTWTAHVTTKTYCINPTGTAPACELLTR